MLIPRISDLVTYPLKGARGNRVGLLQIDPKYGVLGDRRFALKRKPTVPDTWSPKGMFFVGMNTPAMVAQGLCPTPQPDEELSSAGVQWLQRKLGLSEPPAVLDTQGRFNLTDSKDPYVSFLNLATLDQLSQEMGVELDPARFRMNVLLEGLEPFEELSWIDKYPGSREISFGGVRFRIEDQCERCKAVEANPETGIYDQPVLERLAAMMEERGFPPSPQRGKFEVMGVLARPLTHGVLRIGDGIYFH
ncbi:MAG: MOSC domain-containing protein [Patescibacteria group bacterium]